MDKENEKAWNDFLSTGLLWFIDTILHLFGWTIVLVKDDSHVLSVTPMRIKYRGYDAASNIDGYRKVTEYLAQNIDALVAETKE